MSSRTYRPTLEPLEDRVLPSTLSVLVQKITGRKQPPAINRQPPVSQGLIQSAPPIPVPQPKPLPPPANRFVNFNPFTQGPGLGAAVPPATNTTTPATTNTGSSSSTSANGGVLLFFPPTTANGTPTAQNLFGGLPASSTPGSSAFAVFPPGSPNQGAVVPIEPFGGTNTPTSTTLPTGPAMFPFPNLPAVNASTNVGPALRPFTPFSS